VEFGEAGLTVRLAGAEERGVAGFQLFGAPVTGREWLRRVDVAVEDARQGLRDAIRGARPVKRWYRRKRSVSDSLGVPLTDVSATWRPGAGVEVTEASPDPDAPDSALVEYRATLKERESRLRLRVKVVTIVAALLLLATVVLVALSEWVVAMSVGLYFFLATLLAFVLQNNAHSASDEVREVDQRLDLGGLLDVNEQRANKLFQVSSLELKRYYDQGRQQRKWIFAFGIFCILVGFGIVAAAFGLLYRKPDADISEKLITASLGAVGAVLANFVAVIYLRMFSSTLKSIVDFHNRLVITHHVNFGNVLAARITDRDLQDETLAEMASALAHVGINGPTATLAPVPDDVPGPKIS